jgi:hypothetical protein
MQNLHGLIKPLGMSSARTDPQFIEMKQYLFAHAIVDHWTHQQKLRLNLIYSIRDDK